MKNFKEELFIPTDDRLWKNLAAIADQLRDQMLDEKKHFHVSELATLGRRAFIAKWHFLETYTWKNRQESKKKDEFCGIYAFAEKKDGKVNFLYIGISRTIIQRFSQHHKGKLTNQATWAWLMAKEDAKEKDNSFWEQVMLPKKRLETYGTEVVNKIGLMQNIIKDNCYFTFVPIKDDHMLMHFAEVYCVNHLEAYWNTFVTH